MATLHHRDQRKCWIGAAACAAVLAGFFIPGSPCPAAAKPESKEVVYRNYFGAKFSRLLRLRSIEEAVADLSIPQATVFVGGAPRPFPVRIGYLEGSKEHQRLRTYCEISFASDGRVSDPLDLLSGNAHLLATEQQIAELKRRGILASAGTIIGDPLTADELRAKTSAFIEHGKYMMNAKPGARVEEKCKSLVRPPKPWALRQPPPRRKPPYEMPPPRNDPITI